MTSPQGPATLRWFFDMLMDDHGIRRSECSIVHVIEEAPEGKGGKPTAKQVRENAPRLREEVLLTSPKVIVTCGPDAFRQVTGAQMGIEDARGYVLGSEHWKNVLIKEKQQVGLYKGASPATGAKKGDPRYGLVTVSRRPALPVDYQGFVIPTYGIEAVEDMGYKTLYALASDTEKAVPFLRGTTPKFDDDDFDYYTALDPSYDAIADYTGDLLAFDIETAGIGSSVVERISLSDGERTHTLPWDEATRVWVQRQFDAARDRGALLVGQNIQFDIPLLAAHDCHVPLDYIFDTMFAAVNLQPDLPKGLGKIASLYLTLRTPWKWRSISEADPERYSAADSHRTALVARKQITMMKEIGWYEHFVRVIMQRLPILMDLHAEGVRVDVGALGRWAMRLRHRLEKYHRLWGRAFPGLNPSSANQLKKLLYTEWQLPQQRNKSDRGYSISTDELACVNLREHVRSASRNAGEPWTTDPRCNPRLFDLLLAIRREEKELSTYAKVRTDSRGRIYPSYLPQAKDAENRDGSKRKGATATGRLASHGPNFQNQSEEATRVFIPDYDDFCFVSGDYKGAELYTLAELSNDRAMKEALRAPGGIHAVNVREIGCSKVAAKGTMFGTCYGAGAPTISNTIKKQDHIFVPVSECKRIQQKLYDLYPDAFSYLQFRADLMVQEQSLTNRFGRTRFFYGRTRDIPAAKDYDPQSTVADIVWIVLKPIAAMARSLGGRLTTTVHDSFLVQVPEKERETCVRMMKAIMQQEFPQVGKGFFIPAEFKVGAAGASWYDLHEVASEMVAA
jgi:DNA polymerase I-like protein with 3'-5' exonuclease and polymerase domains